MSIPVPPMVPLSDAERSSLTQGVSDALLDTCVIHRYQKRTPVVDEHGNPVVDESGNPTYTGETYSVLGEPQDVSVDSAPTPCRFWAQKPSQWFPFQDYVRVDTDARLVLPQNTDISDRDTVTITHRYGVELAVPFEMDVHGDPTPGVMSLEVALVEHHL